MKTLLSQTSRRKGGEQRAQQFNAAYQQGAARRRVKQETFVSHNQAIASDGYAAISAYMRAPAGLRLLHPEHIQFLRPEQLGGKEGIPLPPQEQRLKFGFYVWCMVWDNLPCAPSMPSNEAYLLQVKRIQKLVGRGLPLEAPLDGVFLAPNDFCDESARPYARRKQRRLFRAALQAAREEAQRWYEAQLRALHAARYALPRKPGQRRPMQIPNSAPQQNGMQRTVPAHDVRYGRPDLPGYDPANLSPARPYGVPSTARMPGWWLPEDISSCEEDE